MMLKRRMKAVIITILCLFPLVFANVYADSPHEGPSDDPPASINGGYDATIVKGSQVKIEVLEKNITVAGYRTFGDVVSISEDGVVTGLNEGNTQIHFEYFYNDHPENECIYVMGVTVLDEKAEISHRYSTLEFYSCEYNGKKITPSVSFPFHTIICGYDYEKKYSNNVDVGMGKLVITGKGAFKGKNTFTFSINPLGTKIVSVSKAKKAFTAKWKKQSAKMAKTRITGYQVQYSASSSFKNSKTVAVKGYSKTSATIKKLKANKKYYVRVRTYKTVSGKNFCSSWSRTKSVVTR